MKTDLSGTAFSPQHSSLLEKIKDTTPTCLRGFSPNPASKAKLFNETYRVERQLECECGGLTGRLLGYPLPGEGASTAESVWIGPLGFECAACERITEILDTDVHGYHAEVAKLEGGLGGAKLSGSGERAPYACPQCAAEAFSMRVALTYWNLDELGDEFDERWEDLFNEFDLTARCAQCSGIVRPTAFGKL